MGLTALASAVWFLFTTGVIWREGGKFTEGLGSLLIGSVITGMALLLGVIAFIAGFLILAGTAHPTGA
ncbi:MAG: hypothetical protein ACE5I8_10815 [Thermodesulfobacteriota bacterium]